MLSSLSHSLVFLLGGDWRLALGGPSYRCPNSNYPVVRQQQLTEGVEGLMPSEVSDRPKHIFERSHLEVCIKP